MNEQTPESDRIPAEQLPPEPVVDLKLDRWEFLVGTWLAIGAILVCVASYMSSNPLQRYEGWLRTCYGEPSSVPWEGVLLLGFGTGMVIPAAFGIGVLLFRGARLERMKLLVSAGVITFLVDMWVCYYVLVVKSPLTSGCS